MKTKIVLLVLLAFFVAACGGADSPTPPVSTLLPELVASPSPGLLPTADAPVETAPPAATDTPAPPPLAVLLAPAGSDPALSDALESGLRPAVERSGLRLERWQNVGALPADLRLLIALPPDPGLAALASAAPQAQFLGIGIPGLAPAPNLSLLGAQGLRPDQQAFMAGVVAAMITDDWRVGVLSVSDTPDGIAARQGFLNGAVYFCGLCLPYYGPIVDYPTYAESPAGASPAEWQAAVQALLDAAVRTLYVAPQVTDSAAWEALRQSDVILLGGAPPSSDLAPRWAASFIADPTQAVLELLPLLLAGQGGYDVPLPLQFTHVNPDLFSPGRQQRAQEILADLLTGYIDTGATP